MLDILQTRIKNGTYIHGQSWDALISKHAYFRTRGFHRGPHAQPPRFILPRKHADTRYFARHIDRSSAGCVRPGTSAGYFPKLVKEKIKDRSISIRLAPSILIPVPLPPPRAAFVLPLVCVSGQQCLCPCSLVCRL